MGINITRRKWCHERMVIEKYRLKVKIRLTGWLGVKALAEFNL